MQELIPTNYGEAVRFRCFGLFLTGKTYPEIEEDTGIPIRMLKRWSRDYDWESERETLRVQAKQTLRNDALFDIVGVQAKHLKTARRFQDLVADDLDLLEEQDDEHRLRFRSMEERAKVYKAMTEIERDALIGTINEDFVLRVLQVIKDNVTDGETRQKISDGIRHLISVEPLKQ